MKITVITLFPEAFTSVLNFSILKRAIEQKRLTINLVNLRHFGLGKYKNVDDRPYGGGTGMILRVDVIANAIENCRLKINNKKKEKIILLDPRGKTFDQKLAWQYSKLDHLILICGHYEGVDERVKCLVDESISIGNYVLSGGEIPAMVIIDSISRLIPGVLKKEEAVKIESFSLKKRGCSEFLLEYPQYTRPREFKNIKVPEVLLTGDHKKIALWREKMTKRIKV